MDGNHHIPPEEMIDKLNSQIIGWATFYKYADYTGKVFSHINTVIFWKLARWLAQRYRTRIKVLLRKWFRRPQDQSAKTWIIHRQNIKGERVTRSLRRLRKGHNTAFRMKTPQTNPFIRENTTGDLFYTRFGDHSMAFSRT